MTHTPTLSLILVLAFGLCGLLRADDELLRNGDFSRGTSGWKGDRNIEEDDKGNKYMLIEADDDEEQVFMQEDLDTKDLTAFLLTFRCRPSEDYVGKGLAIRFSHPSGMYYEFKILLKNQGEWDTIKGRFREMRTSDEVTLEIHVLPGEGTVMFDDISLKPLGAEDEEDS